MALRELFRCKVNLSIIQLLDANPFISMKIVCESRTKVTVPLQDYSNSFSFQVGRNKWQAIVASNNCFPPLLIFQCIQLHFWQFLVHLLPPPQIINFFLPVFILLDIIFLIIFYSLFTLPKFYTWWVLMFYPLLKT